MSRGGHWILGAGQPGCLYDYGPECYPTKLAAVAGADWLVDDGSCSKRERQRMRGALRRDGIYYFSDKARRAGCHAYVQISHERGPMPERDE